MKNVGQLFQTWLHYKGLTQKELSNAIGISEQQLGVILRSGPEKWKLSYFVDACKFMNLHPKTFFEDWDDSGNAIFGNVDNTAILGSASFIMNAGQKNDRTFDLQERLKDKEDQIASLKEIIALQRSMLKNLGVEISENSKDN